MLRSINVLSHRLPSEPTMNSDLYRLLDSLYAFLINPYVPSPTLIVTVFVSAAVAISAMVVLLRTPPRRSRSTR